MKKIIILLLLCCLRQMTLAQGTIQLYGGPGGPGGGFPGGLLNSDTLSLNISFSPLPGSPGTNQPVGNASYSLNPLIVLWPYSPEEITTNSFNIWINLGTNQPTDGWVYQMADDGSLQPVMELTNLATRINPFSPVIGPILGPFTNIIIASWPGILTNFSILPIWPTNVQTFTNGIPLPTRLALSTNYYYGQGLTLSTDQVQSLAEGKWYAEVDYGDDKYLGNLKPSSMAPPTASITVSPATDFPAGGVPIQFGSPISEVVITSGRNEAATVTLNGSRSTDPYYLPLQFTWTDGTHVVADETNVVSTWQPGTYQITLEVNDGYNSGTQLLVLKVLSPEEAVNELGPVVEQSYVNRRTTRALTSDLSRAQNSFARGDSLLGAEQLIEFQNRVRQQMLPADRFTANMLIEDAQQIIMAVGGSPGPNLLR